MVVEADFVVEEFVVGVDILIRDPFQVEERKRGETLCLHYMYITGVRSSWCRITRLLIGLCSAKTLS